METWMLPTLSSKLATFALVCVIPLWMGCSEEATDDSSLTVNGFPATLRVGDTTAAFTCTKQVRNSLGRMETDATYENIFWESADSAIVMPSDRVLTGLKKGKTRVVAHDKSSRLKSDSLTLVVE
jgi:hypothetical protein